MYSVVPQRTWPCWASSLQSQVKLINQSLINHSNKGWTSSGVSHCVTEVETEGVCDLLHLQSNSSISQKQKHHLDVRFHVSVTNNCIMSVLHQQMALWVNYNIYIKIFCVYKTWGCLSLHQIIKYMTFWSHNWLIKKDRTAVDELMPTLIINKHIGNKPEHDKSDLVYDFDTNSI